LVGAGRLLEAGFVDHAEAAPTVVPRVAQAGVRADGLQQVERAERVVAHAVPEVVVAATPDQPHVASLDLVRRERQGAVHVMEVVFRRLRERSAVATGLLGLVEYFARLGLRMPGAARGDQAGQQEKGYPPLITNHRDSPDFQCPQVAAMLKRAARSTAGPCRKRTWPRFGSETSGLTTS